MRAHSTPNATGTCSQCGCEFPCRPYRLQYYKDVFCSRSCQTLFRTGREHRPVADRFWEKVQVDSSGCWNWIGCRMDSGRTYGQLKVNRRLIYAHRFSYELHKGPIPDGLFLDHLCRTPSCVNPDHLEPVTNRENCLRGECPTVLIHRSGKCRRGHEMSGENVGYSRDGAHRRCRTCSRASSTSRRKGVSMDEALKIVAARDDDECRALMGAEEAR